MSGNTTMKTLMIALAGALVGALATGLLLRSGPSQPTAAADSESKPLYWVAPMDPNYRRDGPGKSPMGMDLVPVYAGDASDAGAGTVAIAPEVVNNLGVRTAAVQRRTWRSEIQTVGYVRYDEDRLVHIHPRVSGWVERLYVKAAGDPVAQGQPLYELYSPELVNAQEELLIAHKRNNSTLIDAATARLRALQMSAEFIEALLRRGRAVQTVTFHAVQGGVVDQLAIREGFYVEPGTTMMSIGQLDEVWVEAEVFERQAAALRAGLPVTMRLDYLPGRTWQGEVDYVYPNLDPELRTVRARLRFANPDGLLRPNMFAQVSIHGEADGEVLVVPREALIRTGRQDRVVLAQGDGRFKSVAVRPGRVGESSVEILEGLAEGDEVVTSAQFLIDSESSKTSDFKRLQAPDGMDHSAMDHSTMDHGDMDHSAMDHGNMDHGTMNHSGMDHPDPAPGSTDHAAMGHGSQGGEVARD
ncbi:efflux RND transporter periplasmic adaptor subunit [Parahaliea mediterranea]|uniref:Efflux RND transporter periplasmic adaptor subunit n=1 Tax=Parahaliea mediterranea TaxID=651086 RepID=A0A939DDX7_9GAMM|nr:efflux RND transporter periplasmic adaptor subunit [Parahaliea mediterranea]MBN7796475.1 efflux RND transporter periplasmic adaptor subunit [Parahaliea mediterranea]